MLVTAEMIVYVQVRLITFINHMYKVIILDLLESEKIISPQSV